MTPERWSRIAQVFDEAIERPTHARAGWLETACDGDRDLRRHVEVLLDAHDRADDFLGSPVTLDPADLEWPSETAPPEAETDLCPPGSRIGPYAITGVAGRGGMGVVYLAEDTRLRRLVALKSLPARFANRPDLRERLRREARAAATITHPSVALVYALEEFGDELFIVSEYVRGHTLREEIAAGPLVPSRALSVARAVAGALAAAHDAGVVHRDLKPENILIGESGVVKVVDFGVAALVDEDGPRLTRTDIMPGTPAYMAPEQLLGAEVDARTDVYALGLVLAEMLTGRHPVEGRDDAGTGMPHQLAVIVERCLQPAPHLRYQSAHQLLDALERADTQATPARRTALHATPRWWWEFHQATAAVVYWMMVIPAWSARGLIGGATGRLFFVATLAAVIVAANLRLHLWFTLRCYPIELPWVRARSGRWIRVGDGLFAAALLAGGLFVDDRWSAISVLLIAVGIGAAVSAFLIEPVTARAAFRDLRE